MAIDIGRLEGQLLQMSAIDAPGREFCDAIAELSRTGRFAQLRDVLPSIVYDELWTRYRQDPAAFVADWRQLANEMRQGFNPAFTAKAHFAYAAAAERRGPAHAGLGRDSARPGQPGE